MNDEFRRSLEVDVATDRATHVGPDDPPSRPDDIRKGLLEIKPVPGSEIAHPHEPGREIEAMKLIGPVDGADHRHVISELRGRKRPADRYNRSLALAWIGLDRMDARDPDGAGAYWDQAIEELVQGSLGELDDAGRQLRVFLRKLPR